MPRADHSCKVNNKVWIAIKQAATWYNNFRPTADVEVYIFPQSINDIGYESEY